MALEVGDEWKGRHGNDNLWWIVESEWCILVSNEIHLDSPVRNLSTKTPTTNIVKTI
jgi:hypothetical protein